MVKFTPPVIKKDEEVKEEEVPPPQKEITASGPKDEKGDVDGIDPGIVAPTQGTGVVAPPPPPAIFSYVEQMPVSGYDMSAYLSKNLHYPDAARESNIEGRVLVKFVVNEDGAVSDVQVQRGIGGGCDEEAKRVVAAMPNWKPGKQNGKPVKVYFTLPIMFKLE
jgi:protein TonB